MIRFGVHCSLRKGLAGALDEAIALGCETLQIFTRSPRMWKMTAPCKADIDAFVRRRAETGIFPLIVHTPYLPNLATSKPALYRRSVEALTEDLRICDKLGADYFVIHPGSYSLEGSVAQGIENICNGINAALLRTGGATRILLENVAGGGRRLGSTFKELALMIDGIRQKERAGICLDTAHALGAGYDIATRTGVDAMLQECKDGPGLASLHLLHMNDSLVPLGSRKDRHQHLGKGQVGSAGFKYLIKRLKEQVPAGIIETPKDSPDADARNLALLFRWRAAR